MPTAQICHTRACTPATKVPSASSVIIETDVAFAFITPRTPSLESSTGPMLSCRWRDSRRAGAHRCGYDSPQVP